MAFITKNQLLKLKKSAKREKVLKQEILMFQQVVEALRRGLSQENLFKLILRSVTKGLGFKRCGIFLLEPGGRYIKLALGIDKNGRFEKNKDRLPLYGSKARNFFKTIILGRKKYFLSNNTDKRVPKQHQYRVPVLNNAMVPIQVGKGRIIGTLAVDNLNTYRFISRSDVAMLTNYATQVGLAIQSLQDHHEMEKMATRDALTGAHNRRSFDEALNSEVRRCHRYRRSFTLILVDADFFKSVNDTYGHDGGDAILKWLAKLLQDNVRTMDFVARVGGEEFAVLLPETPPQVISVVVRRLLKAVREGVPPVPAMVRDKRGITVSLGVASYRKGPVTAQQIYKLADESLYQAKHEGRNRAGRFLTVTPQG
jgi:diguanylate cyclase (GGDEF)-like protein